MPEYDNTNTFVLFYEEDKASEKHPDYTGTVELTDGSKKRLAAWKQTSKTGRKFLSGRVSEPREDSDF